MDKIITEDLLAAFANHLYIGEKSKVTIEKYVRDCTAFINWAADRILTKELTIGYKEYLVDSGYAVSSVNSMLASLNSLMEFMDRPDCRVKALKSQRQTYLSQDRELTKAEYIRLLTACEKNIQLNMLLQTVCSTGIRVSELQYITVDAVKRGQACIRCKNKNRVILIPRKLQKKLIAYIKVIKIKKGPVFATKTGNPLDRSHIWKMMKSLCKKADVNRQKVFPHNLRKLFARTFYSIEKDIAKLADVLGHSNIETTRIYIMTSYTEHCRKIDRLNLLI